MTLKQFNQDKILSLFYKYGYKTDTTFSMLLVYKLILPTACTRSKIVSDDIHVYDDRVQLN